MRALVITSSGGLRSSDVVTPVPGPRQILVRIHATAINRADLLQRRGMYPAPAGAVADIPGLEYAGEVAGAGEGVGKWRAGDRVMGIVGGGSYAEYVVVHEDEALAIPNGTSFEDAAAIPEAFLTAFDALQTRLRVRPGETVLIHAVAGGVGTAASQLAKQMGCMVFGTARSAWKLERVAELGVDIAIDTSRDSFVEVVRAHTNGDGVSAIVDLVGGDYLGSNLLALATLGRIAVVGLVAGSTAPLDMRQLLNKRATIVGTVMRSRPVEEKIEVAQLFASAVLPQFERGVLRPVVDCVMKMEEAEEAQRRMEENKNFGKIVLAW